MSEKNPGHITHFCRHRILLFLCVILMVSCAPFVSTPTATETVPPATAVDTFVPPTQTPTISPTTTPTLAPLGSEGNPFIIGFVLTPDKTNAIEASEDIAFLISENTEYTFENAIYPDFQSLATAVINADIHLYWLSPFEYLFLHQQGAAEVLLMTNHLGVYAYGVQYLAHIQRGFTAHFDPQTNESINDPITALQQFAGTRPCFISPNSIPGYLVPLGVLTNTSTPTLDPVFTYNYNAMIRALFIQGICDFGVSYALIGDPRNSSDIVENIPDAQTQIAVIWQSAGIIPNTNLSTSPEVPLNIRVKLQEAILDLPDYPEGLALLSTALEYNVEALKIVSDSFYNPLRSAVAPLELDFGLITQQQANP